MNNINKTDILIITIVLIVLLLLVCVATQIPSPKLTQVKEALLSLQAAVTALAIIVGGVLAYRRLQIFRTFEPHLTITNRVSHRLLGNSYFHIAVTATLHNSSRVKMEFREAFFLLQRITPTSDEGVESLYTQYSKAFEEGEYESIQWPTLDEIPRTWEKDVLIVEPGESHQETCEFIVSKGVQSVIIYVFFYNSRVPPVPEGWGATVIHDLAIRD